MEEPHKLECILQTEDNQVSELQEKIKVMWKTIEDLKVKVLEERKLLKKEKSENEKMMEEQSSLRKQLSVFHLPHCPAYHSPPCPVHSLSPHIPFRPGSSEIQFDTYFKDRMGGFLETQGGRPRGQSSFEGLMLGLETQPGGSLEDLFEECHEPTACDDQDPTSSFTLLMSEQWRDRLGLAASGSGADKDKHNTQVNTTLFPLERGEPQFSNTTPIYHPDF